MTTTTARPPEAVRTHVRWMVRRDMPQVLAIEEASSPCPWGEEQFLAVLRERNCIGMVAEVRDRLFGFMVYEMFKSRLHLASLAVHPFVRRLGVGSQLVGKLLAKLAGHRRTRITADVRESATAAHLFFRRQGFVALQVSPGFFRDTGEDAYAMEFRLPGPEGGDA